MPPGFSDSLTLNCGGWGRGGGAVKGSRGDFFWVNFGEKQESRAKALLAPAGESLEHNTLVAAGPNLRADGAFRLPLCILQRVDLRGVSQAGREVLEDRL